MVYIINEKRNILYLQYGSGKILSNKAVVNSL